MKLLQVSKQGISFWLTIWLVLLLGVLLSACSASSRAPEPTPAPGLVGLPFEQALGQANGELVSLIGYYYEMNGTSALVAGLSFSHEQPQPLEPNPAKQIWLSPEQSQALSESLDQEQGLRYTAVLATGQLEGTGGFGPDGSYGFRFKQVRLDRLVPQNFSVSAVAGQGSQIDGQFLRVAGALISNKESALLSDEVTLGGFPSAEARQVKLSQTIQEQALLNQLKVSPNGKTYFGKVEVEGFMRDGVLHALAIIPIDVSQAPRP
jgi:hypothetical protein